MAEQTALVQALRRGSPLTAQQRALIAPERSDIITVYRELQARRRSRRSSKSATA